MKDRIIQLRKSLELTQGEFGKQINLTDAMVSLLESGKKKPLDRTVRLICYTFNVSEEWLRYGTGGMFNPSLEAGNEDEDRLLTMFRKLTAEMRQVVLAKVRELLGKDTSWDGSALKDDLSTGEDTAIEKRA